MYRRIQILVLCVCFLLFVGCASDASAPATTATTSSTTTSTATSSTSATSVSTTETDRTIVTVTTQSTTASTTEVQPTDPPAEEMRAVWFAFSDIRALIGSKSVNAAKTALDAAMQQAADFGLNTVIFHVRVNSDAYYVSDLFKPAAAVSDLLDAGFDPLAYAIESAHRNGLQLHAWINPYRIGADASFAVCDATFEYNGRHYYIPTDPAAQTAILDGVREVLAYDVDGLQFDDYFYPTGGFQEDVPADFEQTAYAAYTENGGTASVGDWRRSHVSAFVRSVYTLVHAEKGRVFGISPSGDMTANYEEMYADTATWMAQAGYVDYICPQLYFGFEHQTAPFAETLQQWATAPRDRSVALYGGLALYKAGIFNDQQAGEGRQEWGTHNDVLARQVSALRAEKTVSGFMLFRQAHLTADAVRETAFDTAVSEQELTNLKALLR